MRADIFTVGSCTEAMLISKSFACSKVVAASSAMWFPAARFSGCLRAHWHFESFAGDERAAPKKVIKHDQAELMAGERMQKELRLFQHVRHGTLEMVSLLSISRLPRRGGGVH